MKSIPENENKKNPDPKMEKLESMKYYLDFLIKYENELQEKLDKTKIDKQKIQQEINSLEKY